MGKVNIGSVMSEFSAAGITDLNVAEIISINGKPDVRLYAAEVPSEEYTDAILGVARKIVTDLSGGLSNSATKSSAPSLTRADFINDSIPSFCITWYPRLRRRFLWGVFWVCCRGYG